MVTGFACGSIKKPEAASAGRSVVDSLAVFFVVALFFEGDASAEKRMPTKLLRLTPTPPFARFLPMMAFGKASVSL